VLAKDHVERDHTFSRSLDSYMVVVTNVSSTDSLVYTVTTASRDCMFRGSKVSPPHLDLIFTYKRNQ